MQKYSLLKKQKGFSILAIILVIVAVIVAIVIWSLSGNSNNKSNNSAVLAATIINQGSLYKDQLEKIRITTNQGSLIDGDVTLIPNNNNELNLFNSNTGMDVLNVPKIALDSTASFPLGIWSVNPVDFSTNEDNNTLYMHTAFILAGLNQSVCENINLNLYGNINIPIFTNTYNNVLIDISTNSYRSILPLHLNNITAVKNWNSGCLLHRRNTTDKEYFYFQVVR